MHPYGCKPTFGTGTLYINGEEFADITDMNVVYDEELDRAIDNVTRLGLASSEFSCSVKMATDEFINFTHAILGIRDLMFETCSDRRIVHLARFSKKKRTRKKNYNRIIRWCELNV